MNKLTLIIGPGRKTRGGITSVINAYKNSTFWNENNCVWVETYRDKSSFSKISYFIKGLIYFILLIPFAKIVHIHFSEPTSAYRKLLFLKLTKLFNKPVIVHFHSFSIETTIKGSKSERYKSIFNSADYIITLSKYWQSEVSKITKNAQKVKVIYNPCPKVTKVSNSRERIILYAGTVNQRKGYKDLLIAFSMIKSRSQGWRLVIAGNGEIEEGKRVAKEYDIADCVYFSGWISGNDKDDLFRRASIFCLPSYAEGFPMAVLEAWSYGLPVITTPVGGIPDIAIEGENALIFTPGDKKELSEKLLKLIESEELRIKMSIASLDLSNTVFNLDNITSQISELYKEIVNERR